MEQMYEDIDKCKYQFISII